MESVWSRISRTLFDPQAWLTLLSTPLPFAVLVISFATMALRVNVWLAIDQSVRRLTDIPALFAEDFAFCMAIAGLLYVAEFTGWYISLPLRLAGIWVIATLSANFISLATTDVPLQLYATESGLQPVERVVRIIIETATANPVDSSLLVGTLVLVNLGLRLLLNSESEEEPEEEPEDPLVALRRQGFAALPPLFWAAIGGAIAFITPIPDSWDVARLANNRVVIKTLFLSWDVLNYDFVTDLSPSANFGSLVDDGVNEESGNRRNVVIVVLESAGYRHSGLEKGSRVKMQNLRALANRGAWSNRAYTPIPNTTKALYGILCSRMPLWQSEYLEIAEENEVECLGTALADAGYATAYFQSALGSFEDRPRFVGKLGFQHFEAWENIKGEPSGYRGSDDLSLAGAFDNWLTALPAEQSFFATLVTSSAQDPYELAPRVARKLRRQGHRLRNASSKKRFALLVLEADSLLEKIAGILEKRGVGEETIVVVVGNHGEGFGDYDVKLHDNNYYEEGIRVPLVIAGPGVRTGEIKGSVSVLDVAATVIGLLDLPSALDEGILTGRNVLARNLSDRPLVFSCHFEGRCYGIVRGFEKVLILPETNSHISFDLEQDPDERRPISIRAGDPRLHEVRGLIRAYRLEREQRTLARTEFSTNWRCDVNAPCKHPDSPRDGVFRPKTDEAG